MLLGWRILFYIRAEKHFKPFYQMKAFVLAILLTHSFFISNAQTKNLINFKNTVITIDGESTDWDGYSTNYDEKSKSSYRIVNDSQKIYFLFKFSEKSTQMKVLRAGLEINIDTLGKNNYPISVIFPFSTDRYNNDLYSHTVTGINPNMDFDSNKEGLINSSNKIKLVGFNNGYSDIMINKTNTLNVEASLKFNNQNELIYELAIPIKLFFDGNPKYYKRPFAIQFNIMSLPFDATSAKDHSYFENNSFELKTKLATPIP